MFTGIIEEMGELTEIRRDRTNIVYTVKCPFLDELKVDQSIAHNGVCLTVTQLSDDEYEVEAIQETLDKTNLCDLKVGDQVNLERCLQIGARLDGHMVQGHVDTTTSCISVEEVDGSWKYTFGLPKDSANLIVSKGSICINGVSLTVVDPTDDTFSVCIIPYTFEHTNFKFIEAGTRVNLEFDILGKYIQKHLQNQ